MVFLIPFGDKYIVSQIGFGQDLGVFDIPVSSFEQPKEGKLLFRVQFGQKSPKRHSWQQIGVKPFLSELLERAQPYGYREIGSNRCFIVESGRDDTQVECCDVDNLEPLATWSHEHIVERFARTQSS